MDDRYASDMSVMQDYAQVPQQQDVTELHGLPTQLHKEISCLDDLLDRLTARLELVLRPPQPMPGADLHSDPSRSNGSPLFIELSVLINRQQTQNERLALLLSRLDI